MLSITVNTLVDENNGVGDLSSVSLREAVAAATSYGNEVIFDESLDWQRIELTAGQISVNQSISIVGNGVEQTIIDANGASRIFNIGGSISVTISGMTITGGYSGANGGGIASAANLTLQSVNLTGNETASHGGGLFHSGGALSIANSTIDDNHAGGAGGGLSFSATSLSISGSTFSHNTAAGGGGLAIGGTAAGGVVNIANSTFSGNVGGSGGAMNIHSASGTKSVTIVNSTITDNHATFPATTGVAGGIYNINPVNTSVTLHNTIVAGNTAYNANFHEGWGNLDTAEVSSHNFIGKNYSNSGVSNGVLGNHAGTSGSPIDPLLAPLGHYGGPTKTHELLPQSLAINAGNSTYASDFDQRGTRYERTLGAGVDIGAVEAPRGRSRRDDDASNH